MMTTNDVEREILLLSRKKEWVKKDGYETRELVNANGLNSEGCEIHQIRWLEGKYSHYHKVKTEYFYFTSGKGKAIIGDSRMELKAGIDLLILPGVWHEIVTSGSAPLEAIMVKTNNYGKDTFAE